MLEALGHQSRRQILLIVRLRGDAMTAGAIADRFRAAWPTVTRHLAVLTRAGLLQRRKIGRQRIYRVNATRLDLVQKWLDHFRAQRPAKPPSWAALPYARMRNTIRP